MPRGKRNVYIGQCTTDECGRRITTVRLHNQKNGKSWKDFKISKYCSNCRRRTPLKLKQERHSN